MKLRHQEAHAKAKPLRQGLARTVDNLEELRVLVDNIDLPAKLDARN